MCPPMIFPSGFVYLFVCFFKDSFIYLREREHEWEGQKESERESQVDSALSTEPRVELNLRTLRSRPEPKPRVGA